MDTALCSNFLYIDLASKQNMLKKMILHLVLSFITSLVLWKDYYITGWLFLGISTALFVFLFTLFFIYKKHFSPLRSLLFNALCLLKSTIDSLMLIHQLLQHYASNTVYSVIAWICAFCIIIFILFRVVSYKKELFRKKNKNHVLNAGITAGVLVLVARVIYKLLEVQPSLLVLLFISFSLLGVTLMLFHNYLVARKEKIDLMYQEIPEKVPAPVQKKKTIKRRTKKLFIIFGAIAGGFLQVVLFAFIMANLGKAYDQYRAKNMPVPAVQYAEFPVRIVYEHNGKQSVIENDIIIQYEGAYSDFNLGSGYNWNRTLSDPSQGIHHFLNEKIYITSGIYYYCSTEYLIDVDETRPWIDPGFYVGGEPITPEEIESQYGIRFIEMQLPQPISNQLVPKK